jgi:hypothetical protein
MIHFLPGIGSRPHARPLGHAYQFSTLTADAFAAGALCFMVGANVKYAAIALFVLGMVAGLRLRFHTLLLLLVLLLLISVAFSVLQHIDLVGSLLTIMIAQAIFQGGYFAGLVARHLFAATRRNVPNKSEGRSD